MNLFATGFPGFIARRLLPQVARDRGSRKVVLLVEKRWKERAEALAEELFEAEVQILTGDIAQPDLGFGQAGVAEILRREEFEWWHLAALYRLEVDLELARRVNVDGTRHLLELAGQSLVSRFQYISTAYVSGRRTGLVREDDLPEPQPDNFKNYYELTKNEAEWLVRQAKGRVPTTIYRFGVVTGDSRTGATEKFDGPYFAIKYNHRWRLLPLPFIGEMQANINIVPVDYIVAAVRELSRQPNSLGKCFHLVDPEPITAKELFVEVSRALGVHPPRWTLSAEAVDNLMRFKTVRRLIGIPRQAMVYLNYPVTYDCSNTNELLQGSGITCPPARSYIPRLVDFYLANRHRRELHLEIE